MVETVTGTNRSAGISFEELLPYDTKEVPVWFKEDRPLPAGPTYVPTTYYTSQEHHDLEMEKLWMRVWQYACHEDDIAEVGDYFPYEIGDRSFLIVRSGPDEIHAFPNACLHRGRMLKEAPGKRTHELRCAFHAWAWQLDGSLKEIPCQWDFPHVDETKCDLPKVQVGRHGRLIFINPDPDAERFEDFLGNLPDHWSRFPLDKRFKRAQVQKVIRANWKIAQDAFAESWHVFSTHPQMVSTFGDPNGKFDAWENYSRQSNVGGTPSPHLENVKDWGEHPGPTEDGRRRERHPFVGAIYEETVDGNVLVTMLNGKTGLFTRGATWIEGEVGHADKHLCQWVSGEQLKDGLVNPFVNTGRYFEKTLPEDMSREELVVFIAGHRAERAAATREFYRPVMGEVVDDISDAELNANVYFNLFPNLMPSGQLTDAIWFRFRPNGTNPNECIMDVIELGPIPAGEDPPPAPPIVTVDADDSWTEAPEIGALALVLDQDTGNMPFIQRGVRNIASGRVQLADYNETKLRHHYLKLNEYLFERD